MTKTRIIETSYLARVEGKASLRINFKGTQVEEVRLSIFEAPRYFEALLQGRPFADAPDITARICGICPVAYQMTAVHALEQALGVQVDADVRALRRLFYCGEWIQSHTLHMYMLHAPDFLGVHDAVALAQSQRDAIERGLRLRRAGNSLIQTVGGRDVHPINVKVGGFYSMPSRASLTALLDELKWAREAAADTARWVAGFEYPDFTADYPLVALSHPQEYPFNDGRIVSNFGLDITAREFTSIFHEHQVDYSTALRSHHEAHTYLVGPLARFNLNYAQLRPAAQQLATEIGLTPDCTNPFKSIAVRAIEVFQACDEAIELIEQYREPAPTADLTPQPGTGFACTEAPRGLLYHYYEVDDEGYIRSANIIPPTSQNQLRIEQDLFEFAGARHDLSDEDLRWACEQLIRSYDPCISCAAHFLSLETVR